MALVESAGKRVKWISMDREKEKKLNNTESTLLCRNIKTIHRVYRFREAISFDLFITLFYVVLIRMTVDDLFLV